MTGLETPSRRGAALAALAALSAGILLFLPTSLVGYTFAVLAAVEGGQGLAWTSAVGLTYGLTGIPAVVGLVLLVIPYALLRASARQVGEHEAVRWTGLLLVGWNVVIALIHLVTGEIWAAAAFGAAAVVILALTLALGRGDVRSVRILGVALAFTGVVLVASLAAVWGKAPAVPLGGQVVHIVLADAEVQVSPHVVHAGEVWFVVEGSDAKPDQAGFSFIHGGYGATCCERPFALSDEVVAGLAQGDYQGTGSEGGWFAGPPVKWFLAEGNYAFVAGAGQPGIPPRSVAVLQVVP